MYTVHSIVYNRIQSICNIVYIVNYIHNTSYAVHWIVQVDHYIIPDVHCAMNNILLYVEHYISRLYSINCVFDYTSYYVLCTMYTIYCIQYSVQDMIYSI